VLCVRRRYHDQVQSPGYPSGDGSCAQPCDCGKNPCGEYLWDFRALNVSINGQTLLEWYVNSYVMNANSANGRYVCLLPVIWSPTPLKLCERVLHSAAPSRCLIPRLCLCDSQQPEHRRHLLRRRMDAHGAH
jgi:hypothetical protein